MSEVAARLRFTRLSAQKARLVCDLVRGLPVDKALNILKFSNKKAAHVIRKVLESAIANAENNAGADIDELKVAKIYADQGATFKRVSSAAKGRAIRLTKPTCHITIVVSDEMRS